jgi:hypothetical protein
MDVAKASILETNASLLHDSHKEVEQRATADAATFYDSTLAALWAKADTLAVAELEILQFKHNLCIEVEEHKEKAHIVVATPAASVSCTKASGKSKRHDPVRWCSRTASIASSCPPLPAPSLLPLLSMPVAQVVELLDVAPLNTTPKSPSFPAPYHEAFAPIKTALDAATEDKACTVFDTTAMALCASVKSQLQSFADSFEAHLSISFTAIMACLDALKSNCVDIDHYPCHSEQVHTSDPLEYEEMDTEAFETAYASHFSPELPASALMLLPEYTDLWAHIDEIFDSIHHQTPIATDLVEHQALYTFILDSFGPKHPNFIPFHHLPLLVEADLVCDYKDWLSSHNVASCPTQVPPANTLSSDTTPLTGAGMGGLVRRDPAPAVHHGHDGGPMPSDAKRGMGHSGMATSECRWQQSTGFLFLYHHHWA